MVQGLSSFFLLLRFLTNSDFLLRYPNMQFQFTLNTTFLYKVNIPKCMVVKTITITESAYDSLATSKSDDESFSTAILRLTKKRSLLDAFGLMKGKEGDDFEAAIHEARREHTKLKITRDKRLWG